MAKILYQECIVEYSTEFEVRVVELTNQLDVKITTIAEIMWLHTVMIYRWYQEYREGKLVEQLSRRITSAKSTKSKVDDKKLKRLRKKVEKLQKENDFLKKWEGYLNLQKQEGSDS